MTYTESIYFECACCNISESKWDDLMKGAKKANGSKIRKMIKDQLPELYEGLCLQYPNPCEHQSQKTETHLIYVHSAIEYFLRIN